MQWKITKDLISDVPNTCVGTGHFTLESVLPHKFRLLDDDGEVYFYGVSNDNNSQAAFDPLDDFGGSFGCTAIEYYNPATKQYEML